MNLIEISYDACSSCYHMRDLKSMSTPSYKKGSTFPLTKMVIYICNVHFELHEDNTSIAAKWLNLKDASA